MSIVDLVSPNFLDEETLTCQCIDELVYKSCEIQDKPFILLRFAWP